MIRFWSWENNCRGLYNVLVYTDRNLKLRYDNRSRVPNQDRGSAGLQCPLPESQAPQSCNQRVKILRSQRAPKQVDGDANAGHTPRRNKTSAYILEHKTKWTKRATKR